MVTVPLVQQGLLLLLISQLCVAAPDIPWQAYHNTSHILDSFKAATSLTANLARYQDIPDPDHNSELSLPLVTVTDFKTGEAGKETILLIAGEHARELITSEIVYWLYQVLAGKDAEFLSWPAAASFASQRKKMGLGASNLQEWVQDLLKKVVFKILPIENIEGRKAVEKGNSCLRKTFSGVDLNRNWATEWRNVAADDESYGGPHPFSEPESRIVKLIAENAPVRASVNIHSGEYALYVPWDSRPDYGPDLPADTQVVLEQLNVWAQCMHGAAGSTAGYLAFGTSMDYMYDKLHIPYPLTIEVYGPEGLGKLSAGGHPRHLLQADLVQPKVQTGVNDAPILDQLPVDPARNMQGGQQAAGQQHPADLAQSQQQGALDQQQHSANLAQNKQQGGLDQQQHPAGLVQNKQQGGAGQEQLRQAQRSQEQHTQQQVKEQLSEGAQGSVGAGQAQAESAEKADCFASFNPPTVKEYQEVVVTWVATLLTLADHVAAHPIASHAAMDAEQHQQPLPKGATHKMDLAQRIGSDEEQQLLRTAKDDLNITSGDEGADSATMMLDKLQQHPQEDVAQITEPATNQRSTYVYPLVLIVGCVLACAWRRSTLSKLLSNRRRVNVSRSRYEV